MSTAMRSLNRVFGVAFICFIFSGGATAQSANPIGDGLIVPGQRIGPIYVGMDVRLLYQTMGEPRESMPSADGVTYDFGGGLAAIVMNTTQRVYRITANSTNYATKEGIRVGLSDLAVRALDGNPYRATPDQELNFMCYLQGIRLVLRGGRILWIDVWSPGC